MLNLSNGSAACPTGGLLQHFTLTPILLVWPGLITLLSVVAMDGYACYVSKSQNYNTEIPLKATVLSGSLAMVTVAILMVISTAFPPSWKLKIFVPICAFITSVLRIPVTIWFAFPSVRQVQAQQAEAAEERRLKQELEIVQAMQRQDERQRAREARQRQQEIEFRELSNQLDKVVAESAPVDEKETRHANQIQNKRRKTTRQTRQAWQCNEEIELKELSNQLNNGISDSIADEEQTCVKPSDTTEVMPFNGELKDNGSDNSSKE